jgi:hypothetical protein
MLAQFQLWEPQMHLNSYISQKGIEWVVFYEIVDNGTPPLLKKVCW